MYKQCFSDLYIICKNTRWVLFIILALACRKSIGSKAPSSTRLNQLMGCVWALQSASSIDSLSYGTKHILPGDSSQKFTLLFGLGPNIDISGIDHSIGGKEIQCGISKISPCASVPQSDTSTIAYDTIFCTSPFRSGYSDTLFITKVSTTKFVFQVRYMGSDGAGVETDSLYFLRYHR